MIKCIIVEDEKSAQDVLLAYIDKTPFLKCIGVFESGLDVSTILLSEINLMFLDIELPEISGISFLKTLNKPPKIIMTTAYSNYAIDAFEEQAMDYLVKPFSYERFYKAISRVAHQLQLEKNQSINEVLLYADKTFHKVKIEDILFLKAEIDYVNVIIKDKSILILDSLKNWEEKLKDYGFIRIHRSYIINKNKIDTFKTSEVNLKDQVLPVGKLYRNNFFKIMTIDS